VAGSKSGEGTIETRRQGIQQKSMHWGRKKKMEVMSTGGNSLKNSKKFAHRGGEMESRGSEGACCK